MTNHTLGSRGFGSTSLVVFLLFALALAGVLAYQAQDAARSHRDAAERALEEYASLAAWEFARQAEMRLRAIQMTAFFMPAVEVNGSPSASTIPTASEFARSAVEEGGWCRCLDSASAYFRLDLRDGELTTAGGAPPTSTAWLRERLMAHALSEDPEPAEAAYGRAPFDPDSVGAYVFRGRRAQVTFGGLGGHSPRTVWYYVSRDAEERPLAAYGFEAESRSLLRPMLRPILDDTPLLPPSLTGGLPNDSLMAVRVTDRAGRELFTSAAMPASGYVATDTLGEAFGDLVVRAALRPGIASRLLIGGLPSSRLPLLLALLGLTAALIVAALVQLRRHHELVRLRSDFVAGVSHELRTPLAQIRLYADLLRSGRLDAEDRERSARVIDQESRRLGHLVENVLRFSPDGSAGRGGALERRELAPLVREIVEDFEPLARTREAELAISLDPVSAAVDADAFRQMLVNLLDNAVKYGPAGQRVRVALERADGKARVVVEDQGPGVPPASRESVWRAYHRLPEAIRSGTGGSGIGLAVVAEIVAAAGGRARVEDAPGGGARFVVELPALDPAAATRSPQGADAQEPVGP